MSPRKRRRLNTTVNSSCEDFIHHLQTSRRIMALCGAGLSAPTGHSTFRGVGGMWREYNVVDLATFDAFKQWPVRVWQFYAGRRSSALAVQPNKAYYALAELAKQKDFITVSQNVDGLSPRANHPDDKIFYIHGSLFEFRCESCEYVECNFDDPLTAALQPSDDEDAPLPDLPLEVLPHCPACGKLLRPNVVWFYEDLPENDVKQIKEWMDGGPIDLLLVIGTSSNVNPAARYSVEECSKGARVAVFNLDRKDKPFGRMWKKDWFFQGDAAILVPEL